MASTEEGVVEGDAELGDLALEIAYLRGLLHGKEQECQQLMADKMVTQSLIEALTRTLADQSVKVATLCAAVTELIAGIEPLDLAKKHGLLS